MKFFRNKTGCYVQACTPELEEYIDAVCPADGPFYVITLAYDYDFWKRVCAKHPNLRLIVRWWVDAAEQQRKLTENPIGAALELVANLWGIQIVKEHIAWGVMGYNEFIVYGNQSIWPNCDLFQATLYDQVRPSGLRLLAFGNPVANLRGPDYARNFPLTLARYQYYSFHSYSWPGIFQGWEDYAGRWEADMQDILKVRPDAKCILGEWGLTQLVTNLPDKKDVGYKAVPKTPEQYFAEDLSPMNDRMCLYEWCDGSAHFMVGAGDHGDHPDGHNWDTMDLLPEPYFKEQFAIIAKIPLIYEEENTMPEFRFGFKTAHDANPDVVGDALSEQMDLLKAADGTVLHARQATTKGELVYYSGSGVKFVPQTLPKV